MKRIKAYGISRTRSSKGKGEIVKQELRDYVNCIHTLVGGGWETMQVLVCEVYYETDNSNRQCAEKRLCR